MLGSLVGNLFTRGGPPKYKCENCRNAHKPCQYGHPNETCIRCWEHRYDATQCGLKRNTKNQPHPEHTEAAFPRPEELLETGTISSKQVENLLELLSYHLGLHKYQVVRTILDQFVENEDTERIALAFVRNALLRNKPTIDPAALFHNTVPPQRQTQSWEERVAGHSPTFSELLNQNFRWSQTDSTNLTTSQLQVPPQASITAAMPFDPFATYAQEPEAGRSVTMDTEVSEERPSPGPSVPPGPHQTVTQYPSDDFSYSPSQQWYSSQLDTAAGLSPELAQPYAPWTSNNYPGLDISGFVVQSTEAA